jgi:hypothetical protein
LLCGEVFASEKRLLESVPQDAILKSGNLSCHDVGTCEMLATAVDTGIIWENETGRCVAKLFYFFAGVESMS